MQVLGVIERCSAQPLSKCGASFLCQVHNRTLPGRFGEEWLSLEHTPDQMYTKLRTTNAIENLNGGMTTYSRHVKRWRSGTMVVRWVSAAIVDAEKKFRRVHGWREITTLVSALGDLEAKEEASTERVA